MGSLWLSGFATAGRTVKPPDRFDLEQIDSYLTTQVLEKGRVGLSVAIMKDGQLVLAKGYGKSSLKDGLPVRPDTLFAIGSVTKQFTCACVLILAQEGRLAVHDKVSRYLPRLARADQIELLDLMNHVSGYPDYYPLDFVDRRMQQPILPDALLDHYAGDKLDFATGTDWSYSNTGYILLGRIVEIVSGQSFGDFLFKRVLEPLAMVHTVYEPGPDDQRLAVGYTSFALSAPEPVAPEAKGWLGAAGGLYSTPSDLAKWDLALLEGKLLKPETYQIMTTPRQLPNSDNTSYACGLVVRLQGRKTVWRHNGAVSGFNAFNALVPSTKSAVVAICNKDGGLGSLPDTLLGLLLKEESNVPKIAAPPAAEVVKKVLAQFQAGQLERTKFGAEFNFYLSQPKLAGAARLLRPYGSPKKVEVMQTRERGGMEVTTTRLTFTAGKELEVLMYRAPNGTIEQFFIDEP